jgi:ketosteroid isomerase-like protein
MLRTSVVLFGSVAAIAVAGLIPETYLVRSEQGVQAQAPAPLPTVDLPPELNRVLRDYERHWKANDGAALSDLFTDDGFINRGGWIRGRDAIRAAYARSGGDLRLRAVGYAAGDTVGYIVGGYRYGDASTDGGKFVLALRRAPRGDWKIAADLDAANRQ